MRKRILSILLAVTVVTAFMPAAAFGAVKADPKHQSDSLTVVKQEVMLYIDESFNYAVDSREYYVEEVWTAIQEIYDDEKARIEAAESKEELVDYDLSGASPGFRTEEAITKLQYLGTLTINKGINRKKGKDPMDACIKNVETYKNNVSAQYKLSLYNGWYQDVASNIKADLNKIISDLKKDRTFMGCAEATVNIVRYDMEYEYDDLVIDDLMDIFGYEFIPENDLGIDQSKYVYTRAELAEDRTTAYEGLMDHVKELMSVYKTKLNPSSKTYNSLEARLINRADKFYAESKKEPELEAILALYEDAMEEMTDDFYTRAGLIPASYGDRLRLEKAIKKLYMEYDQTEYSSGKLASLEKVFEAAYGFSDKFTFTKAENASESTRRSAIDKYIASLKKQVDKIPVKTVELKQNKDKYKKSLKNKYAVKGKKKYNQKKVKTILKKAYAAINKCTEPADVPKVSRTYAKKLDNTINKYTIKTSKKGKGTITKSRTVKYGSSFKVKFTPKKGWKIKRIYVDGKRLKKIMRSYTFKNVKKSHRIKVVFTR